MKDVIVVFDAAGWRDRFFFHALGEVVGEVATVFEAVVSTSSYAVVVKTS